MKFFLDTANIDEIKRVKRLGLVNGVTTNPTIIAHEGRDFEEVIKEICSIVDGPVSAEVIGLTTEEMVKEARVLATWTPNVVVKIPMTEAGLAAVHILSKEGTITKQKLLLQVYGISNMLKRRQLPVQILPQSPGIYFLNYGATL